MKKLLVILLSFCCCVHADEAPKREHAFALVHIGKELPPYMLSTVKQIRTFNPKSPIFLVASHEALKNEKVGTWEANLVLVPYETLEKTPEHEKFFQTSEKKKNYYKGFVNHTTERFYYLYDLIAQFELENVIHLENDVLLYAEAQDLLPVLCKHYPALGVTFDNDKRGIAGFMFIRRKNALRDFLRFINTYEHRRLDMQLLSIYRKKCGEKKIKPLPVLMDTYHAKIPLKSKKPEIYSARFEEFQAIFDAAALGQWVGGQDPRNGPCEQGFVNQDCIFDASTVKVDWEVDLKGRKVPFTLFDGKKVPIINLHIHSKQLEKYLSQ